MVFYSMSSVWNDIVDPNILLQDQIEGAKPIGIFQKTIRDGRKEPTGLVKR